MAIHPKFGDQVPFCEPYWYQGFPTPYYTQKHVEYRKKVRDFMEKEVKPYRQEWIKNRDHPVKELHRKLYKLGITGIHYPKEAGGQQPDDYDMFYELILIDEGCAAGPGFVLGQLSINSLVIPLVLHYASDFLKNLLLKPIIEGDLNACLAISEPYAGSDVANLKTTAKKDGEYYVINGVKKWITGGLCSDYICCVARTGDDDSGMLGLSVFIIDATLPGVKIRRMDTQFDNAHNTSFITLSGVRVHEKYMVGEEGMGFTYIMHNFNHERLVIIIGAIRHARNCYQQAFHYAMKRKTFGKPLMHHQVIRYKLAEMARQIEACHSNCEQLAYAFKFLPDHKLGAQCSLLKVQATKCYEYCAREASQIFGGNSIVKEGQGIEVERMNREVRALSIFGGSEEVMLDFSMRASYMKAKKLMEGQNAKL